MNHRRIFVASLVIALVSLCMSPRECLAKPDINRRGGQWGVLLGASLCVPGRADCHRESLGDTRPSFGMGVDLGYRMNRFLFFGAGYNYGMFNPTREIETSDDYSVGYQNSVFGLIRPILPLWRFDIGVDLGPGFSRQAFRVREGAVDKVYSQGFAFKIAPLVDIFVTRRFYIGAKVDIILNAHRRACVVTGDVTNCKDAGSRDVAPVHQLILGVHLGTTFL